MISDDEFGMAQSYALYVLWGAVCIPTACYIIYQLKDNWDEEWLIKRRRPLIVIICITSLYQTLS